MLLHHESHGTGDGVLLVHGFGGDITDWDFVMPSLAEAYRVIAIDLRGHGASGAPSAAGGYTLAEMADDVWETLDAAGVRAPLAIAGHSMGGGIAQLMTLARPERVRSLVLVDSIGEAFTADMGAAMLRLIALAEQAGLGAVANFLDATAPRPEWIPPEERERDRDRLRRSGVIGYVASTHALLRWPGIDARLRQLSIPALVVVGEHDAEYMQQSAALLVEAIASATLVSIEGAGHVPQRERHEAFLAALRGFLAAHHGATTTPD